jgi:hypothetical protein
MWNIASLSALIHYFKTTPSLYNPLYLPNTCFDLVIRQNVRALEIEPREPTSLPGKEMP